MRQVLGVEGAFVADTLQFGFGFCGVVVIGAETGEAKDHRAVSGVADASEGEAAVQRGAHTRNLKRLGAQVIEEPSACDHRADGVRRGRADADFEHIKDRKKHSGGTP